MSHANHQQVHITIPVKLNKDKELPSKHVDDLIGVEGIVILTSIVVGRLYNLLQKRSRRGVHHVDRVNKIQPTNTIPHHGVLLDENEATRRINLCFPGRGPIKIETDTDGVGKIYTFIYNDSAITVTAFKLGSVAVDVQIKYANNTKHRSTHRYNQQSRYIGNIVTANNLTTVLLRNDNSDGDDQFLFQFYGSIYKKTDLLDPYPGLVGE